MRRIIDVSEQNLFVRIRFTFHDGRKRKGRIFWQKFSVSLSRMLNIRNVRNAKLEFQIKCYLKNLSREQTSSDPKNLLRGEKEANTLWAGNYQADIKCVRGEAKKKKVTKLSISRSSAHFPKGTVIVICRDESSRMSTEHLFIYLFISFFHPSLSPPHIHVVRCGETEVRCVQVRQRRTKSIQ